MISHLDKLNIACVKELQMKSTVRTKLKQERTIVKKCHCCGGLTEAQKEVQQCATCGKSFLPLNYFTKIHGQESYKFNDLFAESHELEEEDLIVGLYVLW